MAVWCFCFKQKTAYEMRIRDWSSDVCASDLGRLKPGARLPSRLDLAAQLGVSRGTVKTAYDALVDEMLLFSAGAAGTRVALSPASRTAVSRPAIIPLPMQENERGFALLPLPFQPGVPEIGRAHV